MDNIFVRLKEIREYLKLNQKDLADLFGVSQTAYSLYESGKREIPDEYKILLRNKYNINLDWLFTGQNTMFITPVTNNNHLVKTEKKEYVYSDNDNVVYINIYSGTVSAGNGDDIIESEVVGTFPVLLDIIKKYNKEKLFIVKANGDSMTPIIYNKDYVIADADIDFSRGDGIYIIRMFNDYFVKRLQFNPDGTVTIISDNPRYEKQLITKDNANIQITGKVIGWFHEHLY